MTSAFAVNGMLYEAFHHNKFLPDYFWSVPTILKHQKSKQSAV
jgi:hypothetical protein